MEQPSGNKEGNKIIVYDLTDQRSLRYMSENEKQNVINNPNNDEIVIDATKCTSASDVMFCLKQDEQNFQQDKEDNNKIVVKNKDHFWLKVDDKLYIKFDSYIQLDDSFLSSNQYKIKENHEELKTRLPVVFFDKDCIRLQFNNFSQDELAYTKDDSKNFHFHKNEEAKKHGQINYENIQHEYFCAKDTTQPLYRNNNTYLRNIGNACKIARSRLPLAVCGINVFKNKKDPSCLCGIGCCSPYGMMDEKATMDLAGDIFPLFNLKNANNENEEKIV